jgi:hypothetical protein
MRAGISLATVACMLELIDAWLDALLAWLRGPRPSIVVPVVVLRDPPVTRIRRR